MIDLHAITARVIANKIRRRFTMYDTEFELKRVQEEAQEAIDSLNDPRNFSGEIADIILFALAAAYFKGVDPEVAILKKIQEIEQREE